MSMHDAPNSRKISYMLAIREALQEEMRRDQAVVLFGEDVARHGGGFGQGVQCLRRHGLPFLPGLGRRVNHERLRTSRNPRGNPQQKQNRPPCASAPASSGLRCSLYIHGAPQTLCLFFPGLLRGPNSDNSKRLVNGKRVHGY